MEQIRVNWNTVVPYMEQIAAAAQYRAEMAYPQEIEATTLSPVHATR